MDKESFKAKLKILVENFSNNIESYKKGEFNETQTRIQFIDPFFKALGWDVSNEQGYAEQYKEVVHEDRVNVKGKPKAPDYSFRIGGQRKFFVEAKKPSVNIKDDIAPSFQIRRYSWSGKLPISILTDFEEFAVFDTTTPPKLSDKASTGRTDYFTFREYLEKADWLWDTFSREAVLKGSFDKYIKTEKRGKNTVDKAFLAEIEGWRELLAKDIAKQNNTISLVDLNFAVQQIIDRIIFLRIAEDRGIEPYETLKNLITHSNSYAGLVKHWKYAHDRFNSSLFDFTRDTITPKLNISDKVLDAILTHLYYPQSPYEFSMISADILGSVYEQFLGKVISLSAGHTAKVEEKPEVKKAGGVYYTPKYIVDYIVENTVDKLLEGKTPKEVEKLKILDPACGSGSFLIGAYEYLITWHLSYYVQNKPRGYKDAIFQDADENWYLRTTEKKKILLNNIYGVDIDAQAVEVSKLSLALKLLENENAETLQGSLFTERILPDLSSNIKCGNSLIGSDFWETNDMSQFSNEEIMKINAFDWEVEFSEIMKIGGPDRRSTNEVGFDAVIGNPPWGSLFLQNEKKYLSERYNTFLGNFDSYLFFIEKAIKLCKNNRNLSFITPDTWIKVPQSKKLREYVVKETEINCITVLPDKIFKGVSANCIIFNLIKSILFQEKKCTINISSFDADLETLLSDKFCKSYELDVSLWIKDQDLQFQIYQTKDISNIVKKIKSHSHSMQVDLDIMQGIVPYSRENHSEEIVSNRLFHSEQKLSAEYAPWIKGRAISRYYLNPNFDEYLKYGSWLHRPRKEKYFRNNRILIQEITGGNPARISAILCNEVLYHDPGIISCLNISDFDDKFLLGILNSFFLSWYHRTNSPKGIRKTFPKVLVGDIRLFPVANVISDQEKSIANQIVSLVDQMLSLHPRLHSSTSSQEKEALQKQIDVTDQKIDRLVYDLYGLTEEEIAVVEGKNT